MNIITYRIVSLKNKNDQEEAVCNCLDLDIAKIRFREIEAGKHKFLTAKPPYQLRVVEFEHDIYTKDAYIF